MPGGTKRAARKYDFSARKYEMTDDCFPEVNHFVNLMFSACLAPKQPGGTTTLFTPNLQKGSFFAFLLINVFFSTRRIDF